MIPLEGASEELTADPQSGSEAASLGLVGGSGEEGLQDMVGCKGGALVDLRAGDGSSGCYSYEKGW